MIKYQTTQSKYDCCGCRACEQICPKQAIEMRTDEEGFLYPHVLLEKCIDCELCNKVCPIEHPCNPDSHPIQIVAAQHKDSAVLQSSSSGGIFSLLAEYVLKHEGVVYGAAFDKNMYLKHIRIDDENKLEKLRGSKYIQSDIGQTYLQTKEDLKAGRLVYFTGTPCQVHGLKLFLRKNYDNLLTSDLICHGTPSYEIFANTLKHIEHNRKGKIFSYSFRDKNIGGWSCSSSSSSYKNEQSKKNKYLKYDRNMSAYFQAFIGGHLMRYVCYKCPFCHVHRPGDITLADCWGIHKFRPDFPNITGGVSMVLVNTEKGNDIWNSICADTIHMPVNEKDAVAYNANLRRPTPMPSEREHSYMNAFEHYPQFLKRYQPKAKEVMMLYIRFYLRHTPVFYSLYRTLKRICLKK